MIKAFRSLKFRVLSAVMGTLMGLYKGLVLTDARSQAGRTSIIGLILVAFVGTLIMLKMTPTIGAAATAAAADTDTAADAVWAVQLSGWLLPLGGVVAVSWLVVKKIRG